MIIPPLHNHIPPCGGKRDHMWCARELDGGGTDEPPEVLLLAPVPELGHPIGIILHHQIIWVACTRQDLTHLRTRRLSQ